MIAVVLGHAGVFPLIRVTFTFHLPVFLIISGYFFNPEISLVDMIKKKLKSLIIPYFTACSLIIVSFLIVTVLSGNADFRTICSGLIRWFLASLCGVGNNCNYPIFLFGIGAIWFLWAIFWGEIILRALFYLPAVLRIISVFVLVFIAKFTADYSVFLPLSIQPGCMIILYIYIGYLWRKYKDKLKTLHLAIKISAVVLALLIWAEFIYNFQSFWLVDCDCGRGIWDIFGSVCASFMVIGISFLADKYLHRFSKIIRFLGKYSMVALMAHTIEMDTFPWSNLNALLPEVVKTTGFDLVITIILRLIWIFLFTYVITKLRFAHKAFGIKK